MPIFPLWGTLGKQSLFYTGNLLGQFSWLNFCYIHHWMLCRKNCFYLFVFWRSSVCLSCRTLSTVRSCLSPCLSRWRSVFLRSVLLGTDCVAGAASLIELLLQGRIREWENDGGKLTNNIWPLGQNLPNSDQMVTLTWRSLCPVTMKSFFAAEQPFFHCHCLLDWVSFHPQTCLGSEGMLLPAPVFLPSARAGV